MRRKTIRYVLIAAFLLLFIFLLQSIRWPSLRGLFTGKDPVIDETPVLIKEIHNLSALVTIVMYDEVVTEASKPKHLPSFPGLRPVPDKIVLVGKGKAYAGVDLKKLKPDDVYTSGDSVSLRLAAPEIFSVIINPSDFETFDEVGKWSEEEVRPVKIRARQQITARALQNDILGKAGRKAKAVMESFLLNTGFKKVNVHFQ